jgi:DNA/RNA-binding domain of Phe-tRNA-synthetase-like protein
VAVERRESLVITDECFKRGLRVDAVVFSHVVVTDAPRGLRDQIEVVAKDLQRRFGDVAALRASPELQAFERIYRSSGVNPNRRQPGCNRLTEFALKRGALPRINNVVDVYNLVSIKWLLSLGAHDHGAVAFPIQLTVVREALAFTGLGTYGRGVVNAGEFAYVDGRGRVICRLDVVQAEFSKVTAATSHVVVIVEGTSSHDRTVLDAARAELIDLIGEYCDGRPMVA